MKKRIIVIGGGVAGMQTALRLAEQGAGVLLLEKENEAGRQTPPLACALSLLYPRFGGPYGAPAAD